MCVSGLRTAVHGQRSQKDQLNLVSGRHITQAKGLAATGTSAPKGSPSVYAFICKMYHSVPSMPFRFFFTLEELLYLYYRDTFIFIIKTILTWLSLASTVAIILSISFLFFPLPFSSNMIISFITVSEVLKYVWLCLKFLTFNSLKPKCNWSHLSRWESCFFGIGCVLLSPLYS